MFNLVVNLTMEISTLTCEGNVRDLMLNRDETKIVYKSWKQSSPYKSFVELNYTYNSYSKNHCIPYKI